MKNPYTRHGAAPLTGGRRIFGAGAASPASTPLVGAAKAASKAKEIAAEIELEIEEMEAEAEQAMASAEAEPASTETDAGTTAGAQAP